MFNKMHSQFNTKQIINIDIVILVLICLFVIGNIIYNSFKYNVSFQGIFYECFFLFPIYIVLLLITVSIGHSQNLLFRIAMLITNLTCISIMLVTYFHSLNDYWAFIFTPYI